MLVANAHRVGLWFQGQCEDNASDDKNPGNQKPVAAQSGM